MAIEGIQAYARCVVCGTVMWTEARSDPQENDQSCSCRCGNTGIVNQHIIGDADQSFVVASLDDLIAAETQG